MTHTEFGGVKVFVQFPGSSILKYSLCFRNCGGQNAWVFYSKSPNMLNFYAGYFHI